MSWLHPQISRTHVAFHDRSCSPAYAIRVSWIARACYGHVSHNTGCTAVMRVANFCATNTRCTYRVHRAPSDGRFDRKPTLASLFRYRRHVYVIGAWPVAIAGRYGWDNRGGRVVERVNWCQVVYVRAATLLTYRVDRKPEVVGHDHVRTKSGRVAPYCTKCKSRSKALTTLLNVKAI